MFGWKDYAWENAPAVADLQAGADDLLITGMSGFLPGTRLASDRGWIAVEELCAGDKLLTFDHGFQTVVDIQRELFHASMASAVRRIKVPEWAFFNARDLWLMPEQGILVECDATCDELGDPYVVVPARLLDGWRDIRGIMSDEPAEVTTLAFADHETVYLEGGFLAYVPCPQPIGRPGSRASGHLYDLAEGAAARYIASCLKADDETQAVAVNPDELPGFQEAPVRPGRPTVI